MSSLNSEDDNCTFSNLYKCLNIYKIPPCNKESSVIINCYGFNGNPTGLSNKVKNYKPYLGRLGLPPYIEISCDDDMISTKSLIAGDIGNQFVLKCPNNCKD